MYNKRCPTPVSDTGVGHDPNVAGEVLRITSFIIMILFDMVDISFKGS